MLVCLIGVDTCVFIGPPHGYFFSCKNGRPHDGCLFGLIAVGHLQSEKACLTISHLEYLRDDVLSWQFSCVLPWIFSSLCCHVLFSTGRYSWAVFASICRNRMASFFFLNCPSVLYHLFSGRADYVWKLFCCSLWLYYCRHIPRARRRGHNDLTLDYHPHHQCVVSKMGIPRGSADDMCCTGKEVVVDAYQCIKISLWWICEVFVRMALEYFCPPNWNGGYCSPPKGKWTSMSDGWGRGDDELGLRKCWVEVVFQYFLPHCVRCMPQIRFTLVVAVVAVIQ